MRQARPIPVSVRAEGFQMDEEQPTFKVVDRRPFNPDGTPRELSPEEKAESEAAASVKAAAAAETRPEPTATTAPSASTETRPEPTSQTTTDRHSHNEAPRSGRDPLDDPASFMSLIMSLASNAAASLGMMPHPVTGESGVDLKTAKHWIDVLGMLEQKTHGNLDSQEAQVIESLLADLRMQYVSLTSAPSPAKFSASDITGGR
jgi:hypothetical protein